MTDPIRTALEAATLRKRYTLATMSDERADTAAAIAVFLRALPACDVMMERNSWEGGPHSTHTLAAAVERAAQEENDGR